MWICLNDAYFSIVASDVDTSVLNVRARRAGDLEKYFPGTEVHRWRNRDYAYRAFVPRTQVAEVIGQSLSSIAYTNFKNSVEDTQLHDAYLDVWASLANLQR